MKNTRPYPPGVAWFMIVAASVMLILGLVVMVLDTPRLISWLPLVILMPLSLGFGIWSLRNQDRR
ncbi:putative membrane protein YqjE [Microbacterium testaceum]|uniref:hypothetical protein n=1 Tax=Microbacterium testaceum TaxID=2033 RepID=UPI0027825460|nr:hypothetical protein [Microbacterium testaceum]MDQ1172197.1 putative membrane protein YqjE [Microbacterium testaceum]